MRGPVAIGKITSFASMSDLNGPRPNLVRWSLPLAAPTAVGPNSSSGLMLLIAALTASSAAICGCGTSLLAIVVFATRRISPSGERWSCNRPPKTAMPSND